MSPNPVIITEGYQGIQHEIRSILIGAVSPVTGLLMNYTVHAGSYARNAFAHSAFELFVYGCQVLLQGPTNQAATAPPLSEMYLYTFRCMQCVHFHEQGVLSIICSVHLPGFQEC